ncbi:phage terminase small subunit [Clostridium sp. AWRP]|uniref:phage terminase small subunit n=1 Tax=Clostridium sp. AWRP TaxID=2212991 RepID=UPI000FD99BB3|nr:phage terminase small subunit [Clostridium sp. AWRP]AZV57936.1 terminase [Clostridium sp. AWRP]
MPRQRSPNRGKAFEIYKEHNGNIRNRQIANILNISEKTVGWWKNKDKWNYKLNEMLQKGSKKGDQFKNKNLEAQGFFSKIFPPETIGIVEDIMAKDTLDMLWENIIIQYTAIARSQKIMNVKNKKDFTKVLKKEKSTVGENSERLERDYELQFAWDKQAAFLQAQSKAMKTLESMIKQYEELLKGNLATEEQKLRIEKLKIDIKNSNDIGNYDKEGINEFIKATTLSEDEVKELFKDDENEEEKTK